MAHAKLRHSSVTSAGATLQKYVKAITLQTPVDKNADKLKRKGDLRLLETGAASDAPARPLPRLPASARVGAGCGPPTRRQHLPPAP